MTSCRYRDGLQETADLVAEEVGLDDHRIAWQSVGRTADPWWGPGIDEMIPQLVADEAEPRASCAAWASSPITSRRSTTSTSRRAPRRPTAGLAFARTPMPNDDPAFCDLLAEVVREHLAGIPA